MKLKDFREKAEQVLEVKLTVVEKPVIETPFRFGTKASACYNWLKIGKRTTKELAQLLVDAGFDTSIKREKRYAGMFLGKCRERDIPLQVDYNSDGKKIFWI